MTGRDQSRARWRRPLYKTFQFCHDDGSATTTEIESVPRATVQQVWRLPLRYQSDSPSVLTPSQQKCDWKNLTRRENKCLLWCCDGQSSQGSKAREWVQVKSVSGVVLDTRHLHNCYSTSHWPLLQTRNKSVESLLWNVKTLLDIEIIVTQSSETWTMLHFDDYTKNTSSN